MRLCINWCRQVYSVALLFQICRVEDINIAGLIKGSIVHFHRARTIAVHSTGMISASGMGKLSGIHSSPKTLAAEYIFRVDDILVFMQAALVV